MKIVSVVEKTVHYVETDGEHYNSYIRHSKNNWTMQIGESDETIFNCEELEMLYLEWCARNNCLSGSIM